VLVTSFAPVRPTAERAPHSIAVLPFHVFDPDGSDLLLAHGIAAEVIDRLADVHTLTVIARSSAFAFEEAPLDPVEIAARLGVEYLLEGHLQREGDNLRVRTRLLDRTGRQLWSKSFDRNRFDVFELQDEIAAAVAASLAPQLEQRQQTAVLRPNAEAYQDYLIGREQLSRYSAPALDAAAAAFERAIGRDPSFARPYGGLALVRAMQAPMVRGTHIGPLSFAQAREAAEHALGMDPGLADAHGALGRIAHAEGAQVQAEASLQAALDLDPHLVEARVWLAAIFAEQGRHADAWITLEKALELDPLHPGVNKGLAGWHWRRGDFVAARQRYLRILDRPAPPLWAYADLVRMHRDFGQLDEALMWAEQGALAHAEQDNSLHALVRTYARLDMPEEAERWLERVQVTRGSPWLSVNSEFLYMLGRFEDVHALNTAYLEDAGRRMQELPFLLQQVVGGFKVLTGRYEEGIAVLEVLFADTFRIPEGLPGPGLGGDFELMFAQFLVHGYQQVGRAEDAESLLDRIDGHIEDLRRAGVGQWPGLYVAEARNHALRGDTVAALAALRHAVNRGWRDYVFERHNPCWESLRNVPEYRSLMALAEADVAAQRQRIKADGRGEVFEARMRAALAH
jgi:TolB-like protein/Tfp pilus assembly protein PilF